ncbi:uncharacterized protein LOC129942364 [Eupeodes corollae]|uniref:uncharacterized protein LOC129942364 n=1 Tax=Eupeodes corollae TaxID=290404 RepID=UPI00248FD646|nr:uncharacterized protein LOC129942364 [Eupeodes corollae]
MHSFWFAVLVLLVAREFGDAVPVNVDQLNHDKLNIDNDSETRLILPPEMTANYFEILKAKSEEDTNFTKAENADSTPMNYLKSSEKNSTNLNSKGLKALMAFDGNKQTPIFITIPIYISSANDGLPIISATIEKINAPSQKASSKKPEDKIKKETEPSALFVDEKKQEQSIN